MDLGDLLFICLDRICVYLCSSAVRLFFASIRIHSRLILLFGIAARPNSTLQAGRIQQILDLLVIHVFLGHGDGAGV